ncbi:hypothetical protein ZOSMA_179G00120 [Zostera marina]|uniref:RIN4 pathogenic type III effector avirulence factor Avr cleavage site domain-containing protein n=1 Tax=Zostera marina TaxID=29655 RepID=A0A0K9PRI3_ZOSMR|nr:hypothetical protein ZOSMA_179G00120 [Zostera marina]
MGMHEWGGGVPQFGGWDDNKVSARTDYSVVFQKARANRKQQLNEINTCSFESDRRFIHQRHKSAQSTLALMIKRVEHSRKLYSALLGERNFTQV